MKQTFESHTLVVLVYQKKNFKNKEKHTNISCNGCVIDSGLHQQDTFHVQESPPTLNIEIQVRLSLDTKATLVRKSLFGKKKIINPCLYKYPTWNSTLTPKHEKVFPVCFLAFASYQKDRTFLPYCVSIYKANPCRFYNLKSQNWGMILTHNPKSYT